jgi:predicted dehydrogenase
MPMERGSAPLRVAVVGLGFGSVHVAAFRSDPRCEVIALSSRQSGRAEAAARELGIARTFLDWRELVANPDVDVVSLAVPAAVQFEIGLAALRAGKHVFFEKPLAPTLEAALEMASELRETKTAINFEFPEIPAFRDAKQSLARGDIGTLRHVAVTWRIETYGNRARIQNWKSDSEAGGGALNLFGSHVFYYLEWLFDPIASVTASLQRPAADPRAAETLCTLSLVTEAAMPIVVSIATDAYRGPGHRIEIYGDEGALILENRTSDYILGFELQRLRRPSDEKITGSQIDPAGHSDGRVVATAALIHRFVDAIVTRTPAPSPNLDDGLRVQQLIDDTRRSSRLRCAVEVEPS